MRLGRMLVAAGALVAAGCGGGTAETSSDVAAMQAYQALGQDVSSTVATYQADTAALPDDAACEAAYEKYEAPIAAMLGRMAEMSAMMDRYLAEYFFAAPPDMACVAEAMLAEFERHRGAACAAPDAPADEAEAAEHVAAMTAFVNHQRARYENVCSMMGMMDAPAESTWTCLKNADGSFTINGQTWTPGAPLPAAEPQPWPMPCGGGGGGGMM